MDALFSDILAQGLDLRLQVTGRSMKPFINNGETVILRRVPPGSLHCGDIIYFVDATGFTVLHRIIDKKIKPGGDTTLTTKGDALLQHDAPISADQILGKAINVEKKLPFGGPVVLTFDSALCKWLNALHVLYRNVRHQYL